MYSVICRYGHTFLLWCTSAYLIATKLLAYNSYFFTKIELHCLHCRFGYPAVHCFHQLLDRLSHDVELHTLKHFTKYCKHCQKYEKLPSRFCFTIKDNIDFNFNIIVNILYIESKPVLHIVDKSTCFQAG